MKLDLTIYGSFGFSFINLYAWLEKLQAQFEATQASDVNMWLGVAATLVGLFALVLKTILNYRDRIQDYRHREEERTEDAEKAKLQNELDAEKARLHNELIKAQINSIKSGKAESS